MAKIELSDEVRAVEALIESGRQRDSASRLLEAEATLGRRPEYRYLRHLYDHVYGVRSASDLLPEVVDLVGMQPELAEATALVAELYEQTGDLGRADLFARVACDSGSGSARHRAEAVLARHGRAPGSRTFPIASRVSAEAAGAARLAPTAASAPVADVPPVDPALVAWFAHARKSLVQRRNPVYGVRAPDSPVDRWFDEALAIASAPSAYAPRALPLARGSLVVLDEAMVRHRRERIPSGTGRLERLRADSVAAFFLAVVLHELDATAVEVAPDDGHCKVLVPSGAGARPLRVAADFIEGKGPSLTQTFDRLAASVEIASSMPPALQAASSRPPKRPSSSTVRVAPPVLPEARRSSPVTPETRRSSPLASSALDPPLSLSPRAGWAAPGPSARLPELALTRPEVEAQCVRRLPAGSAPGLPPALDLAAVARAFADTPFALEIAARLGERLAPIPVHLEALERYLSQVRGRAGSAADKPVWHPSDSDEALIVSCGAFLGEVLIAEYGGLWEADPDAPSDARLFRVLCHERVASWPMTYLFLRLKNGAPYDLANFVPAVGALLPRP